MNDVADHVVTLKVSVTLKLTDGDPQPNDYIIDAFAAAIGRLNTANPPLSVSVASDDDDDGGEYEVWLVGLADQR